MAYHLKIYKGSVQFLWENYDIVFLELLTHQTAELEKSINKEVSGKSSSGSPTEGFSLSNLEDSPCDENTYKEFLKRLEEAEQKTNKKNEEVKNKKVEVE